MFIHQKLCVRCKGKLLCGLKHCPLYDKIDRFKKLKLTREIEAPSPPNFLISWKGYPKVAVGPSLSLNGIQKNAYETSLEEFVSFRANQLRTFQMKGIRTNEETALSVKPVNFDVKLKSITGQSTDPRGIIASAEKIVPGEVKIPGKIYSLVDNYDIKAKDALLKIKDYGFEYMVQTLSTGNLGIPTQRKLVPTRWAITAVDSILAKNYFLKTRNKPQIQDFELYQIEHWDNHFLVVLLPWGWAFEMMEKWFDGEIIHDGEYGRLKKNYASNITGAYYATRLEVLKHLSQREKSAACMILRQIGDKYIYPVGVWHLREAVEKALQTRPEKFNSLSELESRLKMLWDWPTWKNKSSVWPYISQQSKLSEFT